MPKGKDEESAKNRKTRKRPREQDLEKKKKPEKKRKIQNSGKKEIKNETSKKRKLDEKSLSKYSKKKTILDTDVHRLGVSTGDWMRISNKQFIYRFDPSVLHTKVDGKRIGICGASGSGKSRLLLEISRVHCKSIPVWMILNPSEPGNHMYTPHVENEAIIHDNEDPKELIKDLYGFKQRQVKRCKDWAIPGTDPTQYKHDPSAGLILDDICEDPTIFNDPVFGWLYCLSRNFKAWIAFLVQHWYMFPKKYRRQFSHVFLFAMSSVKDMKDAWQEVGSVFEKFVDFRRACAMAHQEKDGVKGTLVIDVMKCTNKIEEKVFWYRHTFKQPPFKYGADWFNKMVNQRFDPNWENKIQEETKLREEQLKAAPAPKGRGRGRAKARNETLDIELV